MRQARRPTRPAGFTLIELLVVISVILLLAALVAPMIQRSLAMAMRSSCQTNLRQLGVATQMYANAWGLYILPAFPTYTNPVITFRHAPGFDYWWHGVGREGGLWPAFIIDVKAFVCPENDAVNPMASCSYTHNWAPWNGVDNVTPAARKVQKVQDPDRTIIYTESYNPVIWDWQWADGSGSLFHRLLDRHGSGNAKGPNCLYMDGHADHRIRLQLEIPDFTPIDDHE